MVKVKNKKRNLAETTAKKRDLLKMKSLNAFEVHINKEKHKVLGRKNKTDRGLPGISRAKAINKRKNTLLHEYKVKDKTNTFLDRRIGEKDFAMTRDDKVMARFAAEKIKVYKKQNMFNLNDEIVLTHRGQTLAEIEKFDDPRSDDEEYSDDENKTGKLDKDFVSEAHFGGGMLSKSDGSTSRKDLIEQLIAESKKRKAEKQKIREQTTDLTEKLDTEWKDLLPIVNASKKFTEEIFAEKPKADDYDIALRELKFQARGTPSNRLKPEEEIAKEEKEKLEALEAERLARMKGFPGDSKHANKHKSVDDLDDGFFIEDLNEEETLTYGGDGVMKYINNEKSEEKHDSNNEVANAHESASDESGESENDQIEFASESVDCEEHKSNETQVALQMNVSSHSKKASKHLIAPISPDRFKDPYDNIPILNISDNHPFSKDKIGEHYEPSTISKTRRNLKSNSTSVKLSQVKSDVGNGCQSSESDDDSEVEENLDENSETEAEDSLSDLKAGDSSSEEEKDPIEKHEFSANPVQRAPWNEGQTSTLSQSILNSTKNKKSEIATACAEERIDQIKLDLLKRKEIMETARQELPYTYKAPESFEELHQLLENLSPDHQSIIVERIIKCNHQSFGGNNKEKLAQLFTYLLQYLNEHASKTGDAVNCFQIFDRLCPHLYDLARADPENAKICIQNILKEKHKKFELCKKKYPGLDTLIPFKLVSLLFPTSDYRHPVVTPALVFMSQILTRCRVRSRSDLSKGLFICTLILEFTLLSKRFSPSTINFLRGVIHMGTPKPPVQVIKTIPPFKSVGESSNLLILESDLSESKVNPKLNLMLAADLIENEMDEDFRIRIFSTAVSLVSEFKSQIEELEAALPIFEPIIKLLSINQLDNYPESIKQQVTSVLKDLNSLKDKQLEYITRDKKKPKTLRLYEPRIEIVYDVKKHRPMSKEKAEREKLFYKYKREVKGAIREVRRDRTFLAKVQIKHQIKSDEDRKRKVKEIFGNAALQQGELNKIKRTK